MDDGLVEAVALEIGHVGAAGHTRCDNQLCSGYLRDVRCIVQGQDPPVVYFPGVSDGGVEPYAWHEIVVFGIRLQVVVDGLGRDITVLGDALFLHGIEAVFEEAMADLRKQIGIDALRAPDAADGLPVVEDDQLRCGLEGKIGRGGNEAIPSCRRSLADTSSGRQEQFDAPAPMTTTS